MYYIKDFDKNTPGIYGPPKLEAKRRQYFNVPSHIKSVERVNLFNTEFVIVEDVTIPDNELHFVHDEKCIGKIINIGSQ